MNVFNTTINLVVFTILFIIGMLIFSNLKWYWDVLIPIIIADLSIFIWLIIELIRFDPKKDVTKDD